MNEELRDRLLEAKIKAAEAEAKKLEADAEYAAEQAETQRLYSQDQRLNLQVSQIELDKLYRKTKEELAANKYNHVYVFDDIVASGPVDKCIEQLTLWMRTDPGCSLEVIFTSPGGSIIDGFALFDFIQLLRSRGHHVTTTALGMAASMAGVLLQAGDRRVMGKQAVILIHEAAFGAIGKTGEVEDHLELVKKLQRRILGIFAERSHLTVKQLEHRWKRKDWWLTSDEALELGIVDEVQ